MTSSGTAKRGGTDNGAGWLTDEDHRRKGSTEVDTEPFRVIFIMMHGNHCGSRMHN